MVLLSNSHFVRFPRGAGWGACGWVWPFAAKKGRQKGCPQVGCCRGGKRENDSRFPSHPAPEARQQGMAGAGAGGGRGWVPPRPRCRERGAELSIGPSCPQAQQAKFLSDVENELEELAVTIAQAKKMVELIKVTL